MITNFAKIAGLVALTLPATAQAQGMFEGDLTLGYSFGGLDAGGSQDFSTPSLKMHSTVSLSEKFEFDLNLGTRMTDFDGTALSLDSTYIAVAPRFQLDNGLVLGAYWETVDNSLNVLPIDLGGSSYGVSLGYDGGNWDIEGYIGASTFDPLQNLLNNILDVDIMDAGLRGNFHVSDSFHLSGHFMYTSIDSPLPDSVDLYSLAVGGEYLINPNWSVYGALSRQWLKQDIIATPVDFSGTRYSIGAAYTFAGGGSAMPVTASIELSRTNLDLDIANGGLTGNGDVDEVRVGLSIPLGHSGRPAPLNSNTRLVSGGGHTVLGQLLGLY